MMARSTVSKNCGVGSDGTERITPPAIRNPKAWVWAQHHVAGRRDRLGDIGKSFLRAERGDDLGVRIELDAKTPPVIGGLRLAQASNAARGGIAVGARLAEGVLQLLDHVGRRRKVRIAHAEIDDIGARVPRGRLGLIDLFEHVRRQTADAVKIFHFLSSSGHRSRQGIASVWRARNPIPRTKRTQSRI
jgi:hypothetical protein